jgi:hypothetical protein
VPQPQNHRGGFKTAIFNFVALYVTNDVTLPQTVKRVVSRPDILFSAADTGKTDPTSPIFLRTGTSKWINNAARNGNPTNAGPGVIVRPIKITFDKLGQSVFSGDLYDPPLLLDGGWASFDGSTNPPVLYPPNIGQNRLLVRLHFYSNTRPFNELSNTLFHTSVRYGGEASLQISTNHNDWISVTTVVNKGSIISWEYYGAQTPISFRVVPAAL